MNYLKKLENLISDVVNDLIFLIETHGKESEHMNSNCLKITDEEFMFNLDGRRYLSEVVYRNRGIELIDNCGHNYDYYVLDPEKFVQVADYLIKKYECDHST